MKDQKALVIKCRDRIIPTFAISGADMFATEVAKEYFNLVCQNGVDIEFRSDMLDVVNEMSRFQRQEPQLVKLPDYNEKGLSQIEVAESIVTNCIINDIPVMVLCATDTCALGALKKYYTLSQEKCSNEFTQLIAEKCNEFFRYSKIHPDKMKLPDMSSGKIEQLKSDNSEQFNIIKDQIVAYKNSASTNEMEKLELSDHIQTKIAGAGINKSLSDLQKLFNYLINISELEIIPHLKRELEQSNAHSLLVEVRQNKNISLSKLIGLKYNQGDNLMSIKDGLVNRQGYITEIISTNTPGIEFKSTFRDFIAAIQKGTITAPIVDIEQKQLSPEVATKTQHSVNKHPEI